MAKPAYAAGDRWIYVLSGSVDSFPGLNASQTGTFRFSLVGRVEVDVVGVSSVISGGIAIPAVTVETTTSGFLNGTFTIPNLGTAQLTGTFTSHASEAWEDRAYLTIRSNMTTTYLADITLGITTSLAASVRSTASTSFASVPPFDLEVGQNASAAFQAQVVANSTATFAGRTQSSENQTDVSSVWRREVLAQERVSVEAGTFNTYKLNQTLGSLGGIGGISGGSNETAYFSNETGYYVRRDAYANGSHVAEMRLKSFSYGAKASSLSVIDWLLLVAAVAVGFILVLLYWRRRKERRPEAPSGGSQLTTVEKKGGGNHGAH